MDALTAIVKTTGGLLVLSGIGCIIISVIAPAKVRFFVEGLNWTWPKRMMLGVVGIFLLGIGLAGSRVIDLMFLSDDRKGATNISYHAYLVWSDTGEVKTNSATLSLSVLFPAGGVKGQKTSETGAKYAVAGFVNSRRMVLAHQGVSIGRGEAVYVLQVGEDSEFGVNIYDGYEFTEVDDPKDPQRVIVQKCPMLMLDDDAFKKLGSNDSFVKKRYRNAISANCETLEAPALLISTTSTQVR